MPSPAIVQTSCPLSRPPESEVELEDRSMPGTRQQTQISLKLHK